MSARAELVADLAELLERAGDVELQVPHDTGLFSLEPRKVAGVRGLLGDAAALLRRVVVAFDGSSSAAVADGATARGELGPHDLADLAFVGRLELDQMRESLDAAVEQGQPWRVVADADRAVTRVVRALAPIESVLRRLEGLEPIERRWFDLDDALASRAHYAVLWLETQRREAELATADAAAVGAALADLAQRIETLRRDELYPFLRVDDRLGLRRLQKRLLEHLEATPDDRAHGLRLWQDASGFFRLLMQISRREELQEHDLHLAARLCAELADVGATPGALPRSLHERLLHLACQDPELDQLLARPTPGATADYRGPLERIRDRLVRR